MQFYWQDIQRQSIISSFQERFIIINGHVLLAKGVLEKSVCSNMIISD
jgi:hypothetical protein